MYGATLPPVFDWLTALGAPVVRLQPPGAGAHDAALTTRVIWRAARCRLIFSIGLGFETYQEPLQAALGKRCPTIERLGDHVQTDDPHIWFDTRHARACLKRMTTLICVKEPGRRAYYQDRLKHCEHQLDGLERQIIRNADKLRGKYYLAQHDAFRLLTRRLGLNSLGSFQPDHERPPSLSHLMRMIKQARHLPVLCVIGSEESGVGDNLARQLRVPYLTLDTMENPDSNRDYFERMRAILGVFENL